MTNWLCGDGVTDPKLKPETVTDPLSDQLDLQAKGLVAKAKAAAA